MPGRAGDGIMAVTEMDDSHTIDESATAPAEWPEPVTAPAANVAVPPAADSRQRRLWTAALAAALVVSAGGLGLLYVDDTNYQNSARNLTTANESLTGRNQNLTDQLNSTSSNLTATLGELATTKAQLEHPQLVLWTLAQQLKGPDSYMAGGIPDTFTYHLQATSSGPMSVSILTLQNFAKAVQCVNNGAGSTNYCMHHSGAVRTWTGVTSVSYDFHLAEGCADYVAVFTAATPVKVTPNVSVTYNPAPALTGVCAQQG
jgi:hypothetical protein